MKDDESAFKAARNRNVELLMAMGRDAERLVPLTDTRAHAMLAEINGVLASLRAMPRIPGDHSLRRDLHELVACASKLRAFIILRSILFGLDKEIERRLREQGGLQAR
jgi:hypothetical protein